MSLLRCQVEFENEQVTYQPGAVLSGRVVLTLEDRQLLKAFALKVSGYASVRWEKVKTKTRKQNKQNKKKKQKKDPYADVYAEQECVNQVEQTVQVFTNREDFISTTNYFIGSEEAFPKIVERGVYFYPFTATLPQKCPSSYEGATGHIRYQLEVFVDYADRRESCYMMQLPLRKAYDLRQYPATLEACDVSVVEKHSPLKFWQHPLQLNVNVPRLGYVSGEHISVHVTLDNPDKLTLLELVYQLNAVGTYVAAHGKKKPKTKVLRTCLAQNVHGFCGLSDATVQHLHELHVPETAPSTIPGDCRCLQVAYEVEVTLKTTQQKRVLNAKMPITIGTVSVRYDVEQQRGRGNSLTVGGSGGPALLVARSMDDLNETQATADAFAAATAPSTETSQALANSMLREAEFMPSSALNKNAQHAKSCEQLDYKPMYPFYELNEAATTTAALQPGELNAVARAAPAPPATTTDAADARNAPSAHAKEQIIRELESMQRSRGDVGVNPRNPAPTAPPQIEAMDVEAVSILPPPTSNTAPPSYTEAQRQVAKEMEALLRQSNQHNQ